jgi:hypothetical protein
MKKLIKSNMECWSKERAWEWYNKHDWICGFNYVPQYAVNSTEMWQEETFDPQTIKKELCLAAEWGFNSCRVFLQYIVWEADPEGYKRRINEFLDIASAYNISVMFVIFDDCAQYKEEYIDKWRTEGIILGNGDDIGKLELWRQPHLGKQDDPIPGISLSVWTPCPGYKIADNPEKYPLLKRYVTDIVSSYSNDERVIVWDLYNEPFSSSRGTKSLKLLRDSFSWARESKPTQPLTVCITGFAFPESDEVAIAQSDIISLHSYLNLTKIKEQIDKLRETGYPILVTEWLGRTLGSCIDTHLPHFHEEKIGNYCWGLVTGKLQTRFPWATRRGTPEPEIWFADLIHPDGTPYDENEFKLVHGLMKG